MSRSWFPKGFESSQFDSGARHGPNVCRLDLSGWLPREVLHPAQSAPRNAPRDERICYMRTADYLASLFAVLAAIAQRVMANPARAIPAT